MSDLVELLQVLVNVGFLCIAIMYFFRPPHWLGSEFSKLKQWAPRLIGAFAHGPEVRDRHTEDAKREGGELVNLLMTLSELMPLLRHLPDMMAALGQSGDLSRSKDNQGGLWT